ncbi:hypothetical protein KSP39_PZI001438 [Platanthera zijinensis]|uniref:NAB domain-containing protein n=1 Tax=Platanthera zijinensis TaxID=2320716 RepID=A0AAP0C1B9_9ASPA
MKRMQSRKSHSWWWDSHISPKNSRWLFENLEQMDRLIKEMLKLIEEEGDSFAKKAEMYYQRRPKLLAHVEDFYRMYRALAERYDNVTGELRKNMPSDLRSQSSGTGSDFGADPPSPSFSPSSNQMPERGKNRAKPFKRAAGFDVFLGSAASSDFSRKGSDDSPSSSSSSQSGSDSEDGKVVDADDNTSGLNARIVQLEEELREAREKIKEYDNGYNGCCDHFVGMDVSLTKDHGVDLSERKGMFEIRILEQEKLIGELKAMAEESSARLLHDNSVLESKVRSLMDSEKNYETKIRALENRVVELEAAGKGEACNECRKTMAELSQSLDGYKMEVDLLRSEKDKLVDSKSIHEAKLRAFEDRVMELEVAKAEACNERGKLIDELNQSLDGYKLKVDILASEKDELNDRVGELVDSTIFLEDKIQAFENRVTELETAKAKACGENAKLRDELSQSLDGYKLKVEFLTSEKDELNARVSELVDSKNIYDSKISELEYAKTEANERVKIIDELNGSLDAYKLKVDNLISERDELNARAKELVDSKNFQESKIRDLQNRVRELESAKNEANESEKLIDEQNRCLERYRLRVDHLTSERDELNDRVSKLVDSKNLHETKIRELESAESKANEREKIIDELNRSLDVYKLKVDFLASEKDELNARVIKLLDDTKCSVENSRSAAEHLHRLHIEHVNLLKEVEGARKESAELVSRVRDLEGEVESQRVLILDGAEGKREAIRQLCFSLEHYRDRYQKLRRMCVGRGRRLPVIAV